MGPPCKPFPVSTFVTEPVPDGPGGPLGPCGPGTFEILFSVICWVISLLICSVVLINCWSCGESCSNVTAPSAIFGVVIDPFGKFELVMELVGQVERSPRSRIYHASVHKLFNITIITNNKRARPPSKYTGHQLRRVWLGLSLSAERLDSDWFINYLKTTYVFNYIINNLSKQVG